MRDYTFGNYICNLREARGYSQFQLGALVGVSDKAVSKWENGNAKPRMQTCIRLAEVLEVPLAEFLQGRPCYPIISKERIMDKKKALWNQAEAELREQYGADMPIAFAGRLATEKLETENSDFILHLDFLGKLSALAERANSMISVRGTVNSSLSSWLMHATTVNPLPPHQYCPHCHRVILHPEVADGWDLPAETCQCGSKLKRDGHSILTQLLSRFIHAFHDFAGPHLFHITNRAKSHSVTHQNHLVHGRIFLHHALHSLLHMGKALPFSFSPAGYSPLQRTKSSDRRNDSSDVRYWFVQSGTHS